MKFVLPWILVFVAAALITTSCATTGDSRGDRRETLAAMKATVKVLNISQSPNHYRPWEMNDLESNSGSGVILKDGSIITNAHVVTESRYLTVIKEGEPTPYEAEVAFIGHECDLALLKVTDPDFYTETSYLEFSSVLPALNSVVNTYGYPLGGERISITKGVVSRIEIDTYIHQWKSAFLQVQTDAAINPGNSGGPVVQNGKIVGIASQNLSGAENIGYMIPVEVVRHFLEDVSDGRFDGFPELGVLWTNLENPDHRSFIGLGEERSGVLIRDILAGSSAEGYLETGDAILAIDGISVANDGSIPFANGRIMFGYLIDKKQIGESAQVSLLRDGEEMTIEVPLTTFTLRIPNYYEYELKPRYLIYGGIVFQQFSLDYLNMWDDWWKKADSLLLYYFYHHVSDHLFPERSEFVVINKVLPGKVNLFLADPVDGVVDTVNGKKITRLDDILEAVEHPIDGYTVITLDNGLKPVVLDAEEAEGTHQFILDRYRISSDRELN